MIPLTNKLFRRRVMDLARAGEPVEPRCPHAPPAGMCGGCTFQAIAYADQLRAKHAALRSLWEAELPVEMIERIDFVGSPDPYGYRTRMDYVASKERFGLRRGGKFNYIIELEECHLLPPAGFVAARAVYERAMALGLPDYNLRSHEGFLRYVVVRRSPDDELLLAVVTAAPDEAGVYATALERLADTALEWPGVVGFHWLVNDSRTDISFGRAERHWGAELLPMRVGARTLHMGPNTFFQNNVHLLLPLLDDVKRAVVGRQHPAHSTSGSAATSDESATSDEGAITHLNADQSIRPTVADLYGGIGTIALHLADATAHVTCVESVEESARLAAHNAAANGCGAMLAVASEVLPYLRDQAPGAFDVIVADPPRTGLGPEVCHELLRLRPARLVYVSCNPLTQVEDARVLAEGYRLTRLTGYDMFPQTPHLESLAVFERDG